MPDTPIVWDAAIRVNSFTANNQYLSRVAALSDGRYVVAFVDTNLGNRIGFRVYEANGDIGSPAIFPSEISNLGVTSLSRLDVTGIDNGGFTIVFTEGGADTNSRAFSFRQDLSLFAQEFVEIGPRDENNNVEIDSFSTGFVAVSDTGDEGVRFVARRGPGQDIAVDLPVGGQERQLEADVAYLGDGRAVVVYLSEENFDPDRTTIAWDIVLTATGQVVGSGTVPDNANDRDDHPAVAALENGGFAIVYRDFQGGQLAPDRQLILRLFDDEGGNIGGATITGADAADDPRISVMGDDIVIVWEQAGTIRMRRYDAENGDPVGNTVVVVSDAFNASNPDVTHTADGRYLVTYTRGDAGTVGADVFSVIYDARDGIVTSPGGAGTAPAVGGTVVGTSDGPEDLYGSNLDDILVVGAGGGLVDGGGGNDIADFSGLPTLTFTTLIADLATGNFSVGDDDYEVVDVETIIGTTGRDSFLGGSANDTVEGGAGNDIFVASAGNDVFSGGLGAFDRISLENATQGVVFDVGNPNAQAVFVGDGTLRVAGVESVSGSNFDDVLIGTIGLNDLNGQGGNDVLIGRGGGDGLSGGAGDDIMQGSAGNDEIFGGTGVDTADYSNATVNVSVNLALGGNQDTGFGIDQISSTENITGGTGHDELTGNGFANRLVGGFGDDRLIGNGGDDVLRPGRGNDLVNGGLGNDTVDFADAAGNVFLSLATTAVQMTNGVDGVAVVSVENAIGSLFDDTLVGSTASNRLSGGDGDDRLIGAEGGDVLAGGRGDDMLAGGAGLDLFVFNPNEDSATITDFQDNLDTIDLRGFGFASVAQAQGFAAQAGNNVVYTFDDGELLTVRGTTIAALNDDLWV